MKATDFRRIALSLEGAEEGSHMGAVDFRVGGRIGATHVRLAVVSEDVLEGALRTAWKLRMEKNAKSGKRSTTGVRVRKMGRRISRT